MGKRILVIDGDLIAYRFAAAGEQRSICVKHIKSNKERIFKTRTAFKEFLAAKDYEYVAEDYSIEDIQTVGNKDFTLSTIKKFIDKLVEFTWADEVEVYLGSGKTHRHYLPLPTPYKGNRKDTIKPLLFEDTRNYLRKKYKAKVIEELEVDDVVTIRSYEELINGNEPILCSIDKDSQQSTGIEVLNYMKDPWELKMIPDIGSLYKEKTTIKGDGLKFLAFQTIAGDDADGYCGYDLSQVKYGPTKAMKALENATTEKEILEVVISEFKKLYPDSFNYIDCHGVEHTDADWRDMLQIYWDCAYMKRSWDDNSSFVQFAGERGVYL
jgi:hypothetical protein